MPVILIVDERSVYRSGLRDLIEARFKKSRVLDASQLANFELQADIDLILIDRDCLNQHSLAVLSEIVDLKPSIRIAVMSASSSRTDVLKCLSVGFHGFLPKLQSDEELLSAIGDLLTGRIYVPRWLADDDVSRPERPHAVNVKLESLRLTRRQNQILPLLAQGMSNKEIARELSIAEGTSKIHTAALLRALSARNRTEAAFIAAKLVGPRDRSTSRMRNKRFLIDQDNSASRTWRSGTDGRSRWTDFSFEDRSGDH
ncbi:LuxR C-terminal-related transcriptional regulator [Bradyrhizobium yuanmingense]|uniref:LuxR C-terminal-related transcriptional regulator n=1 Tax=Bradyrhizobium yuanmingense TaxID=108015 RepID=UPI0023B9B04D|nr:response regulator transcription factor [Bradyrhizobium yuanmingense]MDF0578233.1 response regulator transcription factor [Bradyrhizobium yuanmingense]